MKAFLRENVALMVGIALPLVCVALFGLAAMVPRWLVDPPQYDLFYTIDDYNYQRGSYEVGVSGGKLKIAYTMPKDRVGGVASSRLFRYDARARTSREIHLDPERYVRTGTDVEQTEGTRRELIVDEVKDIILDPALTSPDGYVFGQQNYSGGLLFFSGGRYRGPSISKGGNTLLLHSEQGYQNARFIGWVVPHAGGTR